MRGTWGRGEERGQQGGSWASSPSALPCQPEMGGQCRPLPAAGAWARGSPLLIDGPPVSCPLALGPLSFWVHVCAEEWPWLHSSLSV